MTKFVTLMLALTLASCAKPWPAAVSTFDGLSPSERDAVEAAIGRLNQRAGKEVVALKPNDAQFSVSFKIETFERTGIDAVGGEADTSARGCTVALSPRIFSNVAFDTIVWHELGHCAGLDHVADAGEVMSPQVSGFRSYPAARLERFVQALRQSAGILP